MEMPSEFRSITFRSGLNEVEFDRCGFSLAQNLQSSLRGMSLIMTGLVRVSECHSMLRRGVISKKDLSHSVVWAWKNRGVSVEI